MKKTVFQRTAHQCIDDETLKLLLVRDPLFLKNLFFEVNPYLIRVCAASGIYEENADEVIHETWERFFANLEKFEGRSQIRTFICGILFNKIREFRRTQGRTIYEEDSEKVVNNAFTVDGWWKVNPQDPQKIFELRQTGSFIKECMEGLSELQKAAFLMREVEEENSDEICNALGVKVSHLRVLLFRAKEKLRMCLEGKFQVSQIK